MTRKISFAALIVFLLLLLMFLWGEGNNLSFHRMINYEKVNAFFAIIGSCGTAVSLFLLYRQTELMNNANLTFQKPVILIESKGPFYIPKFNKEVLSRIDQWNPFEIFLNKDDRLENPIIITNYGIGMALNVYYQYNVDVDLFNKFLMRYDLKNLDSEFFLKKNELGLVKPNDHLKIFPPYFYMYALAPQFLSLDPMQISSTKLVYPTNLTLVIGYENLQGTEYKKTYNVNFSHSKPFPKQEGKILFYDRYGTISISFTEIKMEMKN